MCALVDKKKVCLKIGGKKQETMVSAPQIIQHFDWWFWGSPKFWNAPIHPRRGNFLIQNPFSYVAPNPACDGFVGLCCMTCSIGHLPIMWITFGNGCAVMCPMKKMSSRSWPLPFASPSLQLIETHQQQAAWSESKTNSCSLKASTTSLDQYLHFAFRTFRLPSTKSRPPAVFPWPREKKKWLHKTRKLGRSPATSEEFAEFLRGESGTLDLVTWYAIHNRSEYHPKEFAHVKEATTKKNFTTTQYIFSLVVHVISKNQPKKPNSLPLEKLEKIHPSSYSPFLSSQVTHWMLVGV